MKKRKKYKLTDETVTVNGIVLRRIKSLINFGPIRAGDFGGYVMSENNLSQSGDAWIYDDAKVFDNAVVFGNATVHGNAAVYGDAKVYGNAAVFGNAIIHDDAEAYDSAWVDHDVEVCGNAVIFGSAMVTGNARVTGNAGVSGNAWVADDAEVSNNAKVYGDASICGDAKVYSNADYIVFKNWWSSGRYFTWTRSNNRWKVGCFYGTGEELVKKAYNDSAVSGTEYKRIVDYVESMLNTKNTKKHKVC